MTPLHVKNLKKTFATAKGVYTAVNGISFSIKEGEVLGLLGANGAGKSTTIFMLLGVLKPTEGTISYFDRDLSTDKSAIMKRVGYVSGYGRLPGILTVKENLEWTAALYEIEPDMRAKKIHSLLERFDLLEHSDKKSSVLSAGQITRAMLAKAFLHDPELVLLDEPTASLDPDAAHEVRKFIAEVVRERRVSVLFTSHNMDEVSALCDKVVFLQKGNIVAQGTPKELAELSSQSYVTIGTTSCGEALRSVISKFGGQIETTDGAELTVRIGHDEVGPMISALGATGIAMTSLELRRPTLEDFFIQMAQGS
jgi:ABC-2 type transport system ATP-binding protein